MKLQDEIFHDLAISVDDIFIKFQDKLDIANGDIEPLLQWELIEQMENLTDIIITVLEKQQY